MVPPTVRKKMLCSLFSRIAKIVPDGEEIEHNHDRRRTYFVFFQGGRRGKRGKKKITSRSSAGAWPWKRRRRKRTFRSGGFEKKIGKGITNTKSPHLPPGHPGP